MKLYQIQVSSFNFLILLFIFSFFVRSLVFQFFLSKNDNFWQVDSTTYHQVAVGINNGEGISHEKGIPTFYRLPGYPLFLSVCYKLFGTVKNIALWVQIFLASLIPILVFFLSLALFPMNLFLAKISSIYSAIHLGLVLYSGFFMSESLFIFLFLLFSIFFLKKNPLFFLSGLFLGFASLVRPVGQYFVILAIVLIFLPFVTRSLGGISKDAIKKIKQTVLLFIGWILPVSFWLIRNYMLLGHIFFHTLPGGHFLYLSAARVAMHEKKCDYWQARENLQKEAEILIKLKEKELGHPLNEIEHCKLLEGLALKYFVNNPVLAVKNWLTDIMRTTLSLYSSELIHLYNDRKDIDYFNKKRTILDMFSRYLFPVVNSKLIQIILFVEILFSFFVLLGFVVGLFNVLFEWRSFIIWLRSTSLVLLFIILALSGGYARMRLPAEPFLIILSFSFWVGCFKKLVKKKAS